MLSTIRPANVLLIEDDENDIELLKIMLKKNKFHLNLDIVTTGSKALDYLNKEKPFSDKPTPDLILLDINLSGKDGLEILETVKQSEETTLIPVAVITSSDKDDDLLAAYSNLADIYLQKPIDFEKFYDFLKRCHGLCFSLAMIDEGYTSGPVQKAEGLRKHFLETS